MPIFRYRAVTPSGEISTGEFDAASESDIVERLREQGLMPMQIAPASDGFSAVASSGAARGPRRRLFQSKRVSRDQVLALTRELATLLRAGLTLDRALEILISLAPTLPVAALMQGVRDNVRGGKSLSQALDAQKGLFSRFYINIVRAGEAGGALPAVLVRLTEFMERAQELRDTVISALIYPTILVGVAVLSVMLLLIYVVPQFSQMFHDAGKALLTLRRLADGSGNLYRVEDAYGRQVAYHVGYFPTLNIIPPFPQSTLGLDRVSQVTPVAAANPPLRYAYTYELWPNTEGEEEVPRLTTISVPSPAGSGAATARID